MVLGWLHVKLSVTVVGSGDYSSFGSSHPSPCSSLINTTWPRLCRLVTNSLLRVGEDSFKGGCINELHWRRIWRGGGVGIGLGDLAVGLLAASLAAACALAVAGDGGGPLGRLVCVDGGGPLGVVLRAFILHSYWNYWLLNVSRSDLPIVQLTECFICSRKQRISLF